MTENDTFQQPSLDPNPAPPGVEVVQPEAGALQPGGDEVAASDPADPLTQAVAESLKPVPVVVVPEVVLKPKYRLNYVLDGAAIEESHHDIPHAVARVSALRSLGIFPRTSTIG